MQVEFRKIGRRRYSVTTLESGRPILEMNPAPGYDDEAPHDLVHFIVERELGLQRGIYGQLAAGGTAGTFRLVASTLAPRDRTRRTRGLTRRGERLLREGRADCAISEHAAQQCHNRWLARHSEVGKESRAVPAIGKADWLRAKQIERICDELDHLSAAWSELAVGEAINLDWSR